jgi:hypothetical protein
VALMRRIAARHGVAVTATQLERWRGFGVLPRSEVFFPGDGGSMASLPEGTLEQALFLASRFRRGKPWQLVALEVARAGRWLTADAAVAALRWAAEYNRTSRMDWIARYLPQVEAEIADDESESEQDWVIAITSAVANAAQQLAGAKLLIRDFVQRARPDLRGEDLEDEIHNSHVALLQASEGNDLSDEDRQRALIAVGLDPAADEGDAAFSLLRLFADVDALPLLAQQLSPAQALIGCREAAKLLEREGALVPPDAFAVLALLLVPEDGTEGS